MALVGHEEEIARGLVAGEVGVGDEAGEGEVGGWGGRRVVGWLVCWLVGLLICLLPLADLRFELFDIFRVAADEEEVKFGEAGGEGEEEIGAAAGVEVAGVSNCELGGGKKEGGRRKGEVGGEEGAGGFGGGKVAVAGEVYTVGEDEGIA